MGKHYVPQEYLKGFAAPSTPLALWQFDKKSGDFTKEPAAIKKIAQRRTFYDDDTESLLNSQVEIPGNRVLRQLRDGTFELSYSDRVALSIYIATMMKRVPHSRKRGEEIASTVLKNVTNELRDQIRTAQANGLIDDATAALNLSETDSVESKFELKPPSNVVEQIESPWPAEFVINLIYRMTWRFVHATGSNYFVTTDNPAFFFQCWGLGSDESEFVFPVSNKLAIFGSWTPHKANYKSIIKKQFVKEANRRIISDATRFVYCHRNENWIGTVAAKQNPFLSRIQW